MGRVSCAQVGFAVVNMMGLNSVIGGQLVRLSVLANQPKLTALLFRKSLRVLGNTDVDAIKVLCVQRSVFEDDVRALAAQESEFQFGLLPKAILNIVMEVFLAKDPNASSLTEFNYHHGCCDSALEAFRRYLDQVVEHLLAWWPAKMLMSGNFGYKQQQELARLFAKRDLPFVVLFKEGLVLPSQLDGMREKLVNRKKFLGSRILFYSEQIRTAILKSDAFDEGDFESGVTGIPRLDQLSLAPAAKEQRLVFYSFYPSDKFRFFGLDEESLREACRVGDQFHEQVLQFATSNPKWQVTIKTKAGDQYLQYVEDRFAAVGGQPQNVVLTSSRNATELLLESKAVVAFMSTTGVEALVANRKVICPNFGDLFGDQEWDYFSSRPELVHYVKDATEIDAALSIENDPMESWSSMRDEFLEQMVNGADGKACDRVLDHLRMELRIGDRMISED